MSKGWFWFFSIAACIFGFLVGWVTGWDESGYTIIVVDNQGHQWTAPAGVDGATVQFFRPESGVARLCLPNQVVSAISLYRSAHQIVITSQSIQYTKEAERR